MIETVSAKRLLTGDELAAGEVFINRRPSSQAGKILVRLFDSSDSGKIVTRLWNDNAKVSVIR